MACQNCGSDTVRRFGRDRYGNQRYRCSGCGKTFIDQSRRPLGTMRLPMEKAEQCLRTLLEGCSVRSTERLTGVHRDTLIRLLVTVGARCKGFLERVMRGVPVDEVQADEIWSWVGCKEKTRKRLAYNDSFGDAYCFIALERRTKMVLAWHLGKRTGEHTLYFVRKLRDATSGRFQLTTDGFTPYETLCPSILWQRVDFSQLVKVYGSPADEHRYSPGRIIDTYTVHGCGDPDPGAICTSHVERSNLSLRMSVRRFTRLTNAFSKKWSNHEAMLALYFAWYNFCRVHQTLKCTPAVQAGMARHTWTIRELLKAATLD